ncbi:hypothetical protein BI330_02795 [Mycobacterium sp. CBMA 623]|nr:hypothetical protein [Mycobacteroides sp. CBMA 326]
MVLSAFFTLMVALFVFMGASIFSGVTAGGDAAASVILGGYMVVSVAVGLWYGGLVLLSQNARKRFSCSTTDEAHIARLQSVMAKINNPGGKIASALINGPLLVLSPGIFVGVLLALLIGSFQRYFSPQEFDAVQRLAGNK